MCPPALAEIYFTIGTSQMTCPICLSPACTLYPVLARIECPQSTRVHTVQVLLFLIHGTGVEDIFQYGHVVGGTGTYQYQWYCE